MRIENDDMLEQQNTLFKRIGISILLLAVPMASTQLITTAGGFLCMTMLAKLGHDVLAASALIFTTQISIMVISMSILLSLSVLIGHAYGAKKYLEAGIIVQQGWTISIVISIFVVIFFRYISDFLIFMGQPKAIAQMVQQFFNAYVFAVVPWLLGVCNQQLCYGTRKQHIDMIANLLGVVILILVAYVLIFGRWGFPQLGIKGLAIAMSAQVWFYFIFTSACFYLRKSFKPFELFQYRIYKDWRKLLYMLKIGWPISLQISSEVLSLFVNSIMVGWLGTKALGAFQIVNQYIILIVIPVFALSQATGVLVGQAYGAKQFHEIKSLGYFSSLFTLFFSGLIAFIFLFFPRTLASIYIDVNNPQNIEVLRLTTTIFAIMGFSQLFDAVRNVLTGALRGLLDTKFPMNVGVIAIWIIGIPLSYIFAFKMHYGLKGIAMGSAIGMLIGASVMIIRWCYHTSNNKLLAYE